MKWRHEIICIGGQGERNRTGKSRDKITKYKRGDITTREREKRKYECKREGEDIILI